MIHLGSSDIQASISTPVSQYGLQTATPNPWFHCMPTTPLFQYWPMTSTLQTPNTLNHQKHGKQNQKVSSELYFQT